MTRTVRLTDARCVICETDVNVEMHHIKGLKYLKGVTVHSEMMRNLNRTQVPLCRVHHRMAHKNGLMNLIKNSSTKKKKKNWD